MKYKLEIDSTLNFSEAERQEAFRRMSRYGTWNQNWWTPNISQDAEKRIRREGFVIVDKEP